MSVTIGTRGSTFIFTAIFYDESGAVTHPSAATLYVAYKSGRRDMLDTIALTMGGDEWMGQWDSDVADGGHASWHIRSAGSNKAAAEGVLKLKANVANPSI